MNRIAEPADEVARAGRNPLLPKNGPRPPVPRHAPSGYDKPNRHRPQGPRHLLVGQDIDARCAKITAINLGIRGRYGYLWMPIGHAGSIVTREGMVRLVLERICQWPRLKFDEPVREELLSRLAQVGSTVEQLRLLASRWPKLPTPHAIKAPGRGTGNSRPPFMDGDLRRQPGRLAAAAGLIAKNVRDIPRLATE